MAIKELISLGTTNHDIAASTEFRAGTVVCKATTGKLVTANRSTVATGVGGTSVNPLWVQSYVGLAADDTARSGNTSIINDPVGSSFVNTSDNTVLDDYANGFYVAPKRALSFNQDETLTDVTNFTAGASGFEGPRRQCAVYSFPGATFVTDAHVYTDGTSYATVAGATGAYTDVAEATSAWAISDLLTAGAGLRAGYLVRKVDTNAGPSIARIDKIDVTGGLVWITQLI